MRCCYYARLAYTPAGKLEFECLEEHLALVSAASALIALYELERLGVVAQHSNLLVDAVRAAALGGAAHDWGKVLYNLLHCECGGCCDCSDLRKELERTGGVMSYPYHEVLSAAILQHALDVSCLADEWSRYAVRSVLLHHQGLRGVEFSRFTEAIRVLAPRVADVGAELLDHLKQLSEKTRSAFNGLSRVVQQKYASSPDCSVLGQIPNALNRKVGGTSLHDVVRDVLRVASEALGSLTDESSIDIALLKARIAPSLPRASTLWEAVVARGVAAAVMLADKVVASCAAGGRELGSVYGRAALYTLEKAVQWA